MPTVAGDVVYVFDEVMTPPDDTETADKLKQAEDKLLSEGEK